jgi:hypothetical protein
MAALEITLFNVYDVGSHLGACLMTEDLWKTAPQLSSPVPISNQLNTVE